jgi:hypothetical protein
LKATYSFMKACITEAHKNSAEIGKLRFDARQKKPDTFPLQWKMDTAKYDMIKFKGYEAGYKPSLLTGAKRLYYDRTKPFSKKVRYYNYFKAGIVVDRPAQYVLPKAWWQVVDLLKLNGIIMVPLEKDTLLTLDMYIIDGYENAPGKVPSNGHYLHHNVKLHAEKQTITFHKGDYMISTNQPGSAYIMSTLEPQAEDSYFSWNFFDGMLQQREYYSDYVFEDMAYKYVQDHPEIKTELENKKKSDPAFAANAAAQLDWVYRHSPHFEKTYMRYPVGRVMR